jgi:hypothetical protein
MSTRIGLLFREQVIPDYRDLGIFAIGPMCRMAFRTPDGFTDPYPAIVDTGASISLIPLQIWKGWSIEAEAIRDSTIRGVVPLKECQTGGRWWPRCSSTRPTTARCSTPGSLIRLVGVTNWRRVSKSGRRRTTEMGR